MRIPLRNQKKVVVAHAVIDDADVAMTGLSGWSRDSTGYPQKRWIVDGEPTVLRMHRIILGMNRGCGKVCDHINGNKLDNRRENLRIVTQGQNMQNRTKLDRRNTSGVRGVSWSEERQKWVAQVGHGRRNVAVGRFDSLEEAADAVEKKRAELGFLTNVV